MELCWIDDNVQSIHQIIDSVFPRLWEKYEDLKLTVILFGDGFKDEYGKHGPTQKSCSDIKNTAASNLRAFCMSIDKKEWSPVGTTYQSRKETNVIDCRYVPVSDAAISPLVSKWKAVGKDVALDSLPDIQQLIEKMGISESAVVALDVCLLKGDSNRCQQGKPILSIQLCKELKETRKCFLYSQTASYEGVRENWEKGYEKLYSEPSKLPMCNRFSLCDKGGNVVFEALVKVIESEEEA